MFIDFTQREGGEREKERARCLRETSFGCLRYAPRLGGQTGNLGVHPAQESNPQPFGERDNAQPTEPPGQASTTFAFPIYPSMEHEMPSISQLL